MEIWIWMNVIIPWNLYRNYYFPFLLFDFNSWFQSPMNKSDEIIQKFSKILEKKTLWKTTLSKFAGFQLTLKYKLSNNYF